MLGAIFETHVLGQIVRHFANKGRRRDLYFYRDQCFAGFSVRLRILSMEEAIGASLPEFRWHQVLPDHLRDDRSRTSFERCG